MNSKWWVILLFFSLSAQATESDAYYQDLFGQANISYKEGAYDSAKTLYGEIIQNGMVSAELYYNLGNCHFKLGQNAPARLFYERALRLDPTNKDIQYNLEITETMVVDKIEPLEQLFFERAWIDLASSLSTDAWAILILVLLLGFCSFLGTYFLARSSAFKQLGFFTAGASLIFLVMMVLLAETSLRQQQRSEAIVFGSSVTVKSEPSLNATDQFVIHEGLKVIVRDENGEWTRVELLDGNSGWIRSETIERI